MLLAVLTLVGVASAGLPELRFSNDFREYFSPDNPELLAFEDLEANYAKSDNILFVVQPEGGDVFTPQVLDTLETLTAEAWKLPFASRVDSITNFQHSRAEGDDLTVEDLVRGGATLDPETLETKRAQALAEPALNGLLLSADTDTTAVNVVFQFPQESLNEVPETMAAARDLAQRTEQALVGLRIELSGVTPLNNAFNESGQRDGATLTPLMYVVAILFVALTLRNLWASLATLAVVALSVTTALGLAGHLGITLTPVSVTAPTLIMTLAIADSIHILVSMRAAWQEKADKVSALREALRVNVVPVLVTSLSTIIGFLALNFSDAPPFHDLGNITALGIAAALLFSLTLLPALLTLLPIRWAEVANGEARANHYDRLADFLLRHPRRVLVGSVLVALGLVAWVPRLELDDQWVRYFAPSLEFRQAADFTDEHLTGLYLVEYSLPAGEAEGIHDPEYLHLLEDFTRWLRDQEGVRHVTSYADVVKRLNQNLHGDDPAFYAIPDDPQQAAQYLLLYELSLPYGLDLGDRIAVDKSSTRVTALLGGTVTTRETRDLMARSSEWFETHAKPEWRAVPSGLGVMFALISKRNIESMLRGNVLAVVLITLLLMVALRSVGLGLLSLIPNSLPILMTLGVWALVVGQVGMAAAMVSVSALGVVVDDTVHFLTKYLRARRERRQDRAEAVRQTLRTVGPALFSTTVILTAGFSILALSTFRINYELGLLTAIAMVLALLADFFLLTTLLLWGHRAES